MASLNYRDRSKIEKILKMNGGSVLDFSNRTFQEFIQDTVSINIDDEKYNISTRSPSKANRLRTFIELEADNIVGALLHEFLEYWKDNIYNSKIDLLEEEINLYDYCVGVAKELKENKIIEDLDVLTPNVEDIDFSKLSESIKDSIDKNEPEVALDRLHTFVTKYIKFLCKKHDIDVKEHLSLHKILSLYLKKLEGNQYIESNMSIRIIKASISLMDAFNEVRNNQSLAHDNPILNYSESIFIFNAITNTIKFIKDLEHKIDKDNEGEIDDIIDWENWAV